MKWLIPRYWIDKKIESSLEDAVESRLDEYFMENAQFRTLLVDHVMECRSRARFERRSIVGLVGNLPDSSRLEQAALRDDFTRWTLIAGAVDQSEYVESAKKDIGHLSYRLLGKEEQMYGEYDRFRSEGTFRLSLSFPLLFLFGTLGATDNWWWLLGISAPVTLAYLAGGSFAEAENTLAAAVTSGRIELPSLERIAVRDVRLSRYEEILRDDSPSVARPLYLGSPRGGIF